MSSDHKSVVPYPVSDDNVLEVVRFRRRAIDARDAADDEARRLNAGLAAYLAKKGVKRLQLSDGSVLRMVEPQDRLVVDPVQLAHLGVDPAIIKAATIPTPVASYPMVDKTKTAGDHVQAPAADATVTDTAF